LQEAGQRSASDPVAKQVSDLYASYMDEAGIERRGAAVLQPYLTRIAAARTRDDLIRLFGTPGYPSPIGVGILPNPADPRRYVAATGQAASACRTAITISTRASSSTNIGPATAHS
jgi:putative endopeptidase